MTNQKEKFASVASECRYSIKVQIREQSERRRAETSRPRSTLSDVDFVFDLDRDIKTNFNFNRILILYYNR